MLNIHNYAARHESPVDFVDFDQCDPGTDPAQPTSRLLEGTQDNWAAEEWSESVILPGGDRATRYYLFSADEINDDGEPLEAEQYPWDAEHVSWIERAPLR